jgi:hypothetical protein
LNIKYLEFTGSSIYPDEAVIYQQQGIIEKPVRILSLY